MLATQSQASRLCADCRRLVRDNPGTPPCKSGQLEEGFGMRSEFSQTGCTANNFFGIMRFFFLVQRSRRLKLDALHRQTRGPRSARSPSVSENYATLTCV